MAKVQIQGSVQVEGDFVKLEFAVPKSLFEGGKTVEISMEQQIKISETPVVKELKAKAVEKIDGEGEFICADCDRKINVKWEPHLALEFRQGRIAASKAYPNLSADERSIMTEGLCLACKAKCKD